jgi:hypothetical protein
MLGMPSQALQALSNEIKANGPDSFSRFFMYASLLNVITATGDTSEINKQKYMATLPQASVWAATTSLSQLEPLDVGKLSSDFYINLRAYAATFKNTSPDPMKAGGMLAKTYTRNSQVADLAFIIERMRGELDTIAEPKNSKNKQAYCQLCFANLKSEISNVLAPIETLSKETLKGIDNAVNASFSVIAALVGLSVLLQAGSALIALIGVGLIVGGVYGAFTYGLSAYNAVDVCEKLSKKIQTNSVNPDAVPAWKQFTTDGERVEKTYKCTLFQTMEYTALAVKEQFNPDDSAKACTDDERREMDRRRVSL